MSSRSPDAATSAGMLLPNGGWLKVSEFGSEVVIDVTWPEHEDAPVIAAMELSGHELQVVLRSRDA